MAGWWWGWGVGGGDVGGLGAAHGRAIAIMESAWVVLFAVVAVFVLSLGSRSSFYSQSNK